MNYDINTFSPIDKEVAGYCDVQLRAGIAAASMDRCEVGLLARDCEKALRGSLAALEEMGEYFASFAVRAFTNDCTDSTAAILDQWRPMFETTHHDEPLGLPRLNDRSTDRTVRLAGYRNRVKSMMGPASFYLILDPDMLCLGVDRLMIGLGEMLTGGWDAMAAQQLCYIPTLHNNRMINYDAFAWRPDWTWRQDDQREISFHHDVRPAGAPPYRVNSAFGGACWYDALYSMGWYDGSEGCEHVGLHKALRDRYEGWRMAVSPTMSTVGFVM